MVQGGCACVTFSISLQVPWNHHRRREHRKVDGLFWKSSDAKLQEISIPSIVPTFTFSSIGFTALLCPHPPPESPVELSCGCVESFGSLGTARVGWSFWSMSVTRKSETTKGEYWKRRTTIQSKIKVQLDYRQHSKQCHLLNQRCNSAKSLSSDSAQWGKEINNKRRIKYFSP